MIEQIHQLEERVESLVRLIEGMSQSSQALRQENEQLRAQLTQAADVREHNNQLQAQINTLEDQIQEMAQEKGKARDLVRSILDRIDAIENERVADARPGQPG